MARPPEVSATEDRAALARAGEPDRYLAALLAPRELRHDLVVLAAFLAEIGRIPRRVSEPMLGEIRLQWWLDAIADFGAGSRTGNPLADALAAVAARRGLSSAALAAVVEARRSDLDPRPFADELELHRYLAGREEAAFRLALGVAGVAGNEVHALFLGAAGRSYGLARLLGELPLDLGRGRLPWPGAWPETADLEAALRNGRLEPALVERLVARGIREAGASLEHLHGIPAEVAHSVNVAVLPCALVEPYLRALQKGRTDPVRAFPGVPPLTRVWRLWRAHRRGRI